jgi:hypothetical protein
MSALHVGDEKVGGRLEPSPSLGSDVGSTKRGQYFATSGLRVGMQAIMMARLISTLAQVEMLTAAQVGSAISTLKSMKWKRRSDAMQTLFRVGRVSYCHGPYSHGPLSGENLHHTQGKDNAEPELLLQG